MLRVEAASAFDVSEASSATAARKHHDGHRDRLRARFVEAGRVASVEEGQALAA